MARIAIIGAGSVVFTRTFLNDLLCTPALSGSTIVLMGPTMSKLRSIEAYASRLIKENGLSAVVSSTTDRREALRGADYVIATLQVGGAEAGRMDKEIPMKYGVDQCIGDTLGPGGVFRALRTIPVMLDIARDMTELCPEALLLNYVNPMGMVCTALGRTRKVSFVGLCHGIQTTLDLIAGYTGVEKKDIDFTCAGINHMAWFLKLEKDGRDLYPILRENIEKPEYYMSEKVRSEVMRHFGYFMTESTDHLSEYLPWFRKSRKAMDIYCDRPVFGISAGPARERGGASEQRGKIDVFSLESTELEPRSVEYCSYIIEAMETGKIFRFNGNVLNKGYITNLPGNCCVEVPVYADRTGLHATFIGELPPQLAALNQSNVTVQNLAVEAAISGDPELAFSAVAMDPLTSAVLTLKEIRDMVGEMLEAQRGYLPQFEGKRLKRADAINIPEGTEGVKIPLDPALAVARRIEKLISASMDRRDNL